MSGIYGIINLKDQPVSQKQMDTLEQNLIHRGVDGKAQWVDKNVGLGHLKLEITPESAYENLPLSYKQWIITADARIDNRDELNDPLSISASERAFTPDSTYIIKAYEKWGKDCVKHLIGDFAFAIWDTVEKTLFCIRDHIGIKPFFYLNTDEKFIFASELKTLVELREIPIELNESKFADYFYFIPDLHKPKDAIFMGFKRLNAAHTLLIQNGQLKSSRYWQLQHKKTIQLPNDEAYALRLRELIIQAVTCRIRTNHPIGITLSGGLDSSSIGCIAARQLAVSGKYLFAVCSVLPENHIGIEEDEREYIESIANQEDNIKIHYTSAENTNIFDRAEESFNRSYLPELHFNYMHETLNDLLKQKGNVRLVLSGETGDCAASHDGRNILLKLFKKLKWIQVLKMAKEKSAFEKKSITFILSREILMPYLSSRIVEIIQTIRKRHIGLNTQDLLLNPKFIKQHNSKKVSEKLFKDNFDDFYSVIINQLKCFQNNFEQSNIQKAARHIEEVIPLADIRLLDFMINLPLEHFYHKGWKRGLIRFAMDGILPPKIQWRRDKGIFAPNYLDRFSNDLDTIKHDIRTNTAKYDLYLNLETISSELNKVKKVKNREDSNLSPIPFHIGFFLMQMKFYNFYINCLKESSTQ